MYEFKKWRNTEHVSMMAEIMTLMEPDFYVEVGVRKGYSFNILSGLADQAWGIDIVDVSKNIKGDFHHGDSDSFISYMNPPGEFIDVLFIDGDHRKEAVLHDFDVLSEFVRTGTGLIFMHDTYPVAEHMLADGYCTNAWEAARKIFKNRKYKDFEIVTIPGPYAGMSIVRKVGKNHLNWR